MYACTTIGEWVQVSGALSKGKSRKNAFYFQKLPVIFCLDRAGLVGRDGGTHHGVFDLAFLRCIPNLIICAPRNEIELRNIMYTAQKGLDLPIAIRYPRGRGTIVDWRQPFEEIEIGTGHKISEGKNLAILTVGPIINSINEAIALSTAKEDFM